MMEAFWWKAVFSTAVSKVDRNLLVMSLKSSVIISPQNAELFNLTFKQNFLIQ